MKLYKVNKQSNLYGIDTVLDEQQYECLPEDHKQLFKDMGYTEILTRNRIIRDMGMMPAHIMPEEDPFPEGYFDEEEFDYDGY